MDIMPCHWDNFPGFDAYQLVFNLKDLPALDDSVIFPGYLMVMRAQPGSYMTILPEGFKNLMVGLSPFYPRGGSTPERADPAGFDPKVSPLLSLLSNEGRRDTSLTGQW